MVDANGLKVMSICVLGTASIIVSFSIILMKVFVANPVVLSVGTSFSAGVFIMIGLAHMLHESNTLFEESLGYDTNFKYVPSYAFVCLGYFLSVFLARGIFSKTHTHDANMFDSEENKAGDNEDKYDQKETAIDDEKDTKENHDTAGSNDQKETAIDDEKDTKANPEPKPAVVEVNDDKKQPPIHQETKLNISSIASTMVALCVHSAMEGAALGIQSTKSGTLLLFIAILLHQWAEDFAAAVSSGKTGLTRKTRIILAVILSWSCPFGIALGWLIQNAVPIGVEAGILGISTGSFLSIACTDMVPEEINGGIRKSWKQFLGLFMGMLSIFCVMINVE